jgi:hypothetical protein
MFDQTQVNTIRITMPTASLDSMNTTLAGAYYLCSFTYSNGATVDTVDSVGIRYRGNTSINSQKKSIKLALDKYISGKEYKGIRKLNLIGNHNDPTYVRERLFYHCWDRCGFAPRRISFVQVFINDINFGLYSNCEEIDKQWLQRVYASDSGNLYKCTYGADLKYQGDNPMTYKNLGGSNSPVYDLQTNETTPTYTDITEFIKTINGPNDANYLTHLDTILDYKNYLKSLALDVYTGNWDSYAWNKSNYLLWHDSLFGKFRFITFDTDNTFGVDWSGIDWTTRDPFKWYHDSEYRALAYRLLNIASCKQLFANYLDSIGTYVVNKDSLFPILDSLQAMLSPYVAADSFKTLDYGYDSIAFAKGFVGTVDGHTPYGIKPFIEKRRLWIFPLGIIPVNKTDAVSIYPNPSNERITIDNAGGISAIKIFSTQGTLVLQTACASTREVIDIGLLKDGTYTVVVIDADGRPYASLLYKRN